MTAVRFFLEDALPAANLLVARALYFVPHANGTTVETYLTDANAVARQINGEAMIGLFTGPLIAAQLAQMNRVERVQDITARNALVVNNFNQMILVVDATGDPSVAAGSALYYFHNADNSFTKVAEYEAMDVVLQWSSITGGPAAAPALIDDAVAKRHAHANQAVLDQFAESGGQPTYNGQPIGGASWSATDW